MERLDKVISSQTPYSRKDIKEMLRQKRIMVNGRIVSKPETKIDPNQEEITIDGKKLFVKEYVYLMLNKPKGYVSATEDKTSKTVLDLVPPEYQHRKLFPAGRLDKDTTGLMIITDDGNFAHNILSPKKHISKTYHVTIDIPLTKEMVAGFKTGVNLIDGRCQASALKILDTYNAEVTLIEGRYHQIKRMFGCYKAKVVELERISMGSFKLPNSLPQGSIREFTKEELLQVTK